MTKPKLWYIWGAIAVAGALKAFSLVVDRYPYYLLGDSASYLQESLTLRPGLARPLGYPAFLRVVLAGAHEIGAVLVVQTVLGVLAAGLLTSIAYRRFRLVAVVPLTFGVLCLWPWTALFERAILAETLALFFLAATFFFLLSPQRRRFRFLGGVSLGLGILTRPVLLSIAPVAIVWILWSDRAKRRSVVRNIALFCVGLLLFILPYMTGIRLIYGVWGITEFDGWTLFGLTGGWTEIDKIGDPEVREIFRDAPFSPAELTPAERKWSEKSPARVLLKHYGATRDRSSISRSDVDRLLYQKEFGPLLRRLASRPPDAWTSTNTALRRIARWNAIRNPGKYAGAVLRGWKEYFLVGGEHRRYFQSPEATRSSVASMYTRSLVSLREALTQWNPQHSWPEAPSGRLERWGYLSYQLRGGLLVFPLVGLFLSRGRLVHRQDFLLAGLFFLALAAAVTSVSEVYDRYTALTTPFLLFINMICVDEMFDTMRTRRAHASCSMD